MKLSAALFTLLATALVACSGSDDNTGDTGSNTPSTSSKTGSGSKTPSGSKTGDSSQSTDSTESSEKTCSSSSLNGRCTEGPNKGKSCCYAPESEDDPPCSSSNQCDTVCEYCK